ncbi:hypothetical protein CBL_11047 [Carabus blaptoides fortunei]
MPANTQLTRQKINTHYKDTVFGKSSVPISYNLFLAPSENAASAFPLTFPFDWNTSPVKLRISNAEKTVTVDYQSNKKGIPSKETHFLADSLKLKSLVAEECRVSTDACRHVIYLYEGPLRKLKHKSPEKQLTEIDIVSIHLGRRRRIEEEAYFHARGLGLVLKVLVFGGELAQPSFVNRCDARSVTSDRSVT